MACRSIVCCWRRSTRSRRRSGSRRSEPASRAFAASKQAHKRARASVRVGIAVPRVLYSRPELADSCIALQEEAGVDVNLLLFLLWQGTLARALSAAEVAELERRIGPWRSAMVISVRALRRGLEAP